MPWINEKLVTNKTRGFVYLIVNTVDNRLYIGKKKTISETRVAVAGRVNKKRITKPSNWKLYYGSSKDLLADIKKHGKGRFKRYILGAFDELHSVNYAEAELQFLLEVLNAESKHSYYNGNIKITTMRFPTNRDYIKIAEDIIKGL